MNHQVSTKLNYTNDVNLIELLALLIKEKKTILITFFLVTLLALGGALYERKVSKKVSTIFIVKENYTEQNILIPSVLEKVYRENGVRDKNEISLDEFKNKFKITGIIPKEIENKREILAKNGESIDYIPNSYRVDLRVGSVIESEKILKDYYNALNEYYRFQNESRYEFKSIDIKMLNDTKYNYSDYLQILEERKRSLKDLIDGRENTRTEYSSYGFGYRKIQIYLKNLETIQIQGLKSYLSATNIVRNPQKFQSEFINRKIVLENKIKEESENAKNYKKLLDDYNFEDDNMTTPKGVKISIGDNPKEKYYIEIMTNYLKTENKLIDLQEQLNELIYVNENLKIGTEDERTYILNSLKKIITNYNEIISEINLLEAKENYITHGEMIKLSSPVEITSDSKAKLIMAIGVVTGLILGIIMVFLKKFIYYFKKFNKGIVVFIIFSFIGIDLHSKEIVTLQFTHKEIGAGLNPDKTPFNLDKILLKEFLVKKLGVELKELKNISIIPIFPKNSLNKAEEKLKNGEENYMYFPTEYNLILNGLPNEKEIKEIIIKKFPMFYTNYFLQNTVQKYEYLKFYDSYREMLKALDNLIVELVKEVELRRNNSDIKEIFYEYNNLYIELSKVKNTSYRDTLNYIKSDNLDFDVTLENTLLRGENKYINLEINSLNDKSKIYENILGSYSVDKKQAIILENGDISLSTNVTSLREKQYIDISKAYLNNLNKQNILKIQFLENERLIKNIKKTTKEQENIINKKLQDIQKELNEIVSKMIEIELRDYQREYQGTIRAF